MKKLFAIILVSILSLCCYACGGEAEELTGIEFNVENVEQQIVSDQTFDDLVLVKGNNGIIIFSNCTFRADIYNLATEFTRVILLDCTFEDGAKCEVRNDLGDVDVIDYAFPKFVSNKYIVVEAKDCVSNVVILAKDDGTFASVTFNGKKYTISDSTVLYKQGAREFVPYQGEKAEDFFVAQYYENGTKKLLIGAEASN